MNYFHFKFKKKLNAVQMSVDIVDDPVSTSLSPLGSTSLSCTLGVLAPAHVRIHHQTQACQSNCVLFFSDNSAWGSKKKGIYC